MKRALIIGINNYPFHKLTGSINDAKSIAGLLEAHQNGDDNFEIKLIEDLPTRAKLKEEVDNLFNNDFDSCLFYYAGHGNLDKFGNGYLVTPDCDGRKYDEGLSMNEILEIANKSRARNKIIILDCCYAGAMGNFHFSENGMCLIGEGVTILSASRQHEKSMEIDHHGVFTTLLLEGLKGGAADVRGAVTPSSLYAYIDRALGALGQRPVFKTNITYFSSLRNVTPQVPLHVIRNLTRYFTDAEAEHKLDPSYEWTNSPEYQHALREPYKDEEKVKIFKELQQLRSIGLVVPVEEKDMYWAAMKVKSCKLTPLGQYYWKLVKNRRQLNG